MASGCFTGPSKRRSTDTGSTGRSGVSVSMAWPRSRSSWRTRSGPKRAGSDRRGSAATCPTVVTPSGAKAARAAGVQAQAAQRQVGDGGVDAAFGHEGDGVDPETRHRPRAAQGGRGGDACPKAQRGDGVEQLAQQHALAAVHPGAAGGVGQQAGHAVGFFSGLFSVVSVTIPIGLHARHKAVGPRGEAAQGAVVGLGVVVDHVGPVGLTWRQQGAGVVQAHARGHARAPGDVRRRGRSAARRRCGGPAAAGVQARRRSASWVP